MFLTFDCIQIKGRTNGGFIFTDRCHISLIPWAQFLNSWFFPSNNECYSSFADKNSFCTLHVMLPATKKLTTQKMILTTFLLQDLRVSQWWLWRMQSSGMLCHVALERTDISEESITSIIRVTRIGKLGMLAVASNWSTRYVPPKRWFLQELHSVTSQNTPTLPSHLFCYCQLWERSL
jgi:hypothetical protein